MYADIINQAGSDYGIAPDLLRAVIQVESSFNPSVIGSKGERGLMQLMPGTAADLGVTDPHNPVQNIRAGAKYLAQQYRSTGNWRDALARYNGGKYYKNSQAQGYADKVIGVYSSSEQTTTTQPSQTSASIVKSGSPESTGGFTGGTFNDLLDKIFGFLGEKFKGFGIKLLFLLFIILLIVFGVWKLLNT